MKKVELKKIIKGILLTLGLSSVLSLSFCFYFINKNFYQGENVDISLMKNVNLSLDLFSSDLVQAPEIAYDITKFDNDFNYLFNTLEVALSVQNPEEFTTLAAVETESILNGQNYLVYNNLINVKFFEGVENDFQKTFSLYNDLQEPVFEKELIASAQLVSEEYIIPEREVATVTMSSAKPVTEEQAVEDISITKSNVNDDLVFFSSDEVIADSFNKTDTVLTKEEASPVTTINKEATSDSIVNKGTLSENVLNAIDKNLMLASNGNLTNSNIKQLPKSLPSEKMDTQDSHFVNSDSDIAIEELKKIQEKLMSSQNTHKKIDQKKSEYSKGKIAKVNLNVFEASLGKGINERNEIPFDITQTYDFDHLFGSDFIKNEKGAVSFETNLNDSHGSIPIVLNGGNAGDYLRTFVDLPLEGGARRSFNVPFFVRDDFESFIREQQPEIVDQDYGFIVLKLIYLDHLSVSGKSSITGIEVGNKSNNDSIKYYCFDKKFEFLGNSLNDDCFYYLISGLIPGSRDITYQIQIDGRTELATKVIHVPASEVYFEELDFKRYEKDVDLVNLFEHHLTALKLSENLMEYNIVKSFTNFKDLIPLASGNHSFELLNPLTPLTSRHYYAFYKDKEDNNPLYVGKTDNPDVVIPTKEFQDYRMQEFVTSGLIFDPDIGCVVQVNTKKPILDFFVNGYADSVSDEDMGLNVRYWDNSGFFSDKAPLTSKSAFITGNHPGVITGRIQYQDKTNDFFISHCGTGTYLIEQF